MEEVLWLVILCSSHNRTDDPVPLLGWTGRGDSKWAEQAGPLWPGLREGRYGGPGGWLESAGVERVQHDGWAAAPRRGHRHAAAAAATPVTVSVTGRIAKLGLRDGAAVEVSKTNGKKIYNSSNTVA